jgi:hypothetical protein
MVNFERFMESAFNTGPKPKPPASKTLVEQLPKVSVSRECISDSAVCSICQEDWILGETALSMPCNHTFHPPCIQEWLKEHNSCPICRFEVLTDDPEYNAELSRRQPAALVQTSSPAVDASPESTELSTSPSNVQTSLDLSPNSQIPTTRMGRRSRTVSQCPPDLDFEEAQGRALQAGSAQGEIAPSVGAEPARKKRQRPQSPSGEESHPRSANDSSRSKKKNKSARGEQQASQSDAPISSRPMNVARAVRDLHLASSSPSSSSSSSSSLSSSSASSSSSSSAPSR